MIPRIEAAETLTAINRAALGAGAGEPDDRAQFFAELERKAAGAAAPPPAKADPQDLAMMGIGVSNAGADLATISDLPAWLGQTDHG